MNHLVLLKKWPIRLSKVTKKSMVTLGVALASGLVITHTLVPPTPGPVGVAGIFDVSVGSIMLWGIIIAIPMIIAPIIATLDVNPVFAALAACIGSLFFSYYNDSFFWVVNRTMGIKEPKEQIQIYSITSTIAWGTGIVSLLIVNMIFG